MAFGVAILGEWSQLIETLRADLSVRGWSLETFTEGTDVELQGERDGDFLRVRCYGPGYGARSGPSFFYFDYGIQETQIQRWAVIAGVELGPGSAHAQKQVPTFQLAGGPGRIVLGSGFWVSPESLDDSIRIVEALVTFLENLRTDLENQGLSAWNALAPGVSPFSLENPIQLKSSSRWNFHLGSGLITGSVLGTIGGFLLDPFVGLMIASQIAPVGILTGAVALGMYFKRQVAPKMCATLARKLKACSFFDVHEPVKAILPLRPVVMINSPYGRTLAAPLFRAGTLGARSTQYDIRLKMSVQTLTSPEQVMPACLIVPPSWAAVELEGSSQILARIPVGNGGELLDNKVQWLFNHEELVNGALEQLLTSLDLALGSTQSGPYR